MTATAGQYYIDYFAYQKVSRIDLIIPGYTGPMVRCTIELTKYKTGEPNSDDFYLMELEALTDG